MTLGELAAGTKIEAVCDACGSRADVDLARLLAGGHADMTIDEFADRLFCGACGRRGVRIESR